MSTMTNDSGGQGRSQQEIACARETYTHRDGGGERTSESMEWRARSRSFDTTLVGHMV
jgi:hypothetical protein